MEFDQTLSCEALLPETVYFKLDKKIPKMESPFTEDDFPNLCRTCLGRDNLKPLLSVTFEDVPLKEIFQKVTSMEVTENDNMPLNICTTCLLDIIRAQAFNEKCRQVNTLLQAVRSNRNAPEPDYIQTELDIKQEDIDEEEENLLIARPYPLTTTEEECSYKYDTCSEFSDPFSTNYGLKDHRKLSHPNIEPILADKLRPRVNGYVKKAVTHKKPFSQHASQSDGDEDWKKTRKARSKSRSAYSKPMTLSPALAAMVGQNSMARYEVIKKVWSIIKERDLYDPINRQFAICDDPLFKVIGVRRFRTFGMMKYLKKHFIVPCKVCTCGAAN